ncbi:MAG: acyl carrier protein [Methylotenera sp.]
MVEQAISLQNEIKDFLVDVLKQENKIDVTQLKLDSHLKDLDIDSFGFLEIIFNIEHQYNISFPKNFDHIKTLQDVINVTHDLVLAKNIAA